MSSISERLAKLSPTQRAAFEKRLKGSAANPGRESTIPRRAAAQPYPLSVEQEQVWFHTQAATGLLFYHIARAYRLRGRLNVEALERAVNEVVRRHENLRTTFGNVNGLPVPSVADSLKIRFALKNIGDAPPSEKEATVGRLFTEAIHAPFDLARGPLVRVMLLDLGEREGEREHALLLVVHHVVTDRVSNDIFFQEVVTLYDAFSKGRPSPLHELPIQYGDFAAWQRRRMEAGELDGQFSFWKRKLANPPVVELPTDRPRSKAQTHRGARLQWELGGRVWERFKTLALAERATRFMGLLAVYAILLRRYTGGDDLLVGSPVNHRDRAETAGLIGYLINMLALRIDTSGDPTFRELLKRVRATTLEALSNQEVPVGQVVRELRLRRDAVRDPLFQAAYVYTNLEGGTSPRESELKVESLDVFYDAAFVELSLGANDAGDVCTLKFDYNADLFDAATVERMKGHYMTLLESVVENPDRQIGELPLLTRSERGQLAAWNLTAASYPREASIHQLFETQAARTPEATALICGAERVSYGELNARANRLARRLRESGVGVESRVGVCVPRSTEMVVSLLGTLKAGAAYVPFDLSQTQERTRTLVEGAGVDLILTVASHESRTHFDGVRRFCLDAHRAEIEAHGGENLNVSVGAENLAYVIHTSGSGGSPKGVEVCHRGVVRLVKGVSYAQLDEEQAILQAAPVTFDAATFELWGALLNGGRCVLLDERVPTARALGRAVRENGVTTMWLTSSLFNALVDTDAEQLRGVRQLIVGGDVLSASHVARAAEKLPGTQIINGYGPTEATTFTCCHRVVDSDLKSRRSIPVGKPLDNTEVYLLDERLQPVPVGVTGELYVGGDGLARGYARAPSLTAERFLPNPFSARAGARMYRTGDLCRYFADGALEFVGRSDRQVKVRGFRVEPEEVERAVIKHCDVRECVVVARESVGGDKVLTAYFIARRDERLAPEQLRARLKESLPDYMIPSTFVRLDDLPRTASGKYDRRALPAPQERRAEMPDGFVAPRDETERQLTRLWEEVLDARPVGVRDDFFELGGHSLLAVNLLARIEQHFGRSLPFAALFNSPTVESLASSLRAGEASPSPDPLS
nr:condensation domain-containing protein [uncultured bacterium]